MHGINNSSAPYKLQQDYKQTTQLNIYVLAILEGLFQLVEDAQIDEYLYTCIYHLDFSLLIISRWISPCGMTLFR